MHPLVADGGEMTVLRDLAAFSYGRWSVDWPESVPEDQRPELPDDRDFGYASKLKRDPGVFGRRFVRADVSITAQDFDNAGKPIPFSGESDVEQVLDDAAKRTDGDVFFEREITRAGLGALVPRVDFDVDSVVPVLIWGKTIPAPVTSIEDVVESGAVVDYRVHVGGQLLQDDAARERANREVERTIAQERRERVKAVSKAQSTATSAQSTADEAKKTADETAELVDGLDIEGSIQRAREAVDSSNAILQLVRQLTGAAAAQGAQAQASASLAIDLARQAEEVLDKLDPLRDDVVAAHAEVARLSGEAARLAQEAAAAVARGEKQVVAAQRAATTAAQDAATSQGLVDEAKALLKELSPLQDAARKSLKDAQSLLDNAGGSGRSLADVLREVAAKHQAVLAAHDDILATHGEVLEIHGEAIKYAAMAAAQAGAAAMQASQAAAEALRAADLNAQAIAALAEADKKLAEADRKLQEQIDVLEESQRLLAQAIRYVAAAAAQAAQAAMSAAQATEENANAIAQTNIAVDAAADSLDALEEASAARDEVMGNIQRSVDAADRADKARDATIASNSKAIAILRYEKMRIATRLSVEIDPEGNNKPSGITYWEHYGVSYSNEFLNIGRATNSRGGSLQRGDKFLRFTYWDFSIELRGNWSGALTWETGTGPEEDSTWKSMTMLVKNGEYAAARNYIDNPKNPSMFRDGMKKNLRSVTANSTNGIITVKVYPEYVEGVTNLGPYMN